MVREFARAVSGIEGKVREIGSPRDNHELRAHVRTATGDAQGRMKELAAFIKRVSAMQMPGVQQQRRQRLIEDFVRASAEFKRVSALAAQREASPIPESALRRMAMQQQQQQQSLAGGGYNRAALSEEQEKAGLLEAARREQIAQIEAEREYVDGVNLEREEEVRQLESSVLQVNEMFRDLASIVQQQGIMIETIDSNVSVAVRETGKGVEEVGKAAKYERATRSKMCCIFLIAVAALAFVVIVIVVPVLITKKKH
jgi:syntaxin 7